MRGAAVDVAELLAGADGFGKIESLKVEDLIFIVADVFHEPNAVPDQKVAAIHTGSEGPEKGYGAAARKHGVLNADVDSVAIPPGIGRVGGEKKDVVLLIQLLKEPGAKDAINVCVICVKKHDIIALGCVNASVPCGRSALILLGNQGDICMLLRTAAANGLGIVRGTVVDKDDFTLIGKWLRQNGLNRAQDVGLAVVCGYDDTD